MPVHAHDSAAGMPEQAFHLCAPLPVRCVAQPEAEGEKPGPVYAGPVLLVGEAFAREVLTAILGVKVVSVPPDPRGQRFLLAGPRCLAHDSVVPLGLRCKEAFGGT